MANPQVGMAMPAEKACCFSIPQGARTVAIIEFIFIGLSFISIILLFINGNVVDPIITVLFLIALGVSVFFLMKAVSDRNPGYCLPYAIIKIIQLVFQGIIVIVYLVAALGLSVLAAHDEKRGKTHDINYGFAIGVVVYGLIFYTAWFIFGIFGVVVAFKTRSHLQRYANPMGQPQGVVIQQPAYVQPPPAYAPPPKQ